ncbi:hypothetical protein GMSM_44390 [Geomonas sp. Red276]
MGILVCYDDFTYDIVDDHQLSSLVESGSILGYDRSADWVKTEAKELTFSSPPQPQKIVREIA